MRQLRTLLATAVASLALTAPIHAQTPDQTVEPAQNQALIARGQYLAVAADCAACHTNPDTKIPYGGGYGITSPLGAIYSSNISPSKTAGIGNYTEAQFGRALRDGIRADGAHLYPAMPYTAYTSLTDADIHALFTYFRYGVKPVDTRPKQTSLPFPYNIRASMIGWNLLFLKDQRFHPDPKQSDLVNRGAYLGIALAHCSTCHTPRNELMAEKPSQFLGGASLSSWYAPNVTTDPKSGIADWSDDDVFHYLKTGDVPARSQAGGPMAEAVEHSFQYLTDDDTKALVAWLRTIKPLHSDADTKPRDQFGAPSDREAQTRGLKPSQISEGETLYNAECAACHQPSGGGSGDHYYPQLFHNSATGAPIPDNLIAAILTGVDRTVGGRRVYMPAFGGGGTVDALNDHQIAALATYVEKQFGNPNVTITADRVNLIRTGGPKPLIARLGSAVLPVMIGGPVVILLALALLIRRRNARRKASVKA